MLTELCSAVIGTGSTGIQLAQTIASVADELVVFQRSQSVSYL